MKKIDDLLALFVEQLRDLYDGEHQQLEILPLMRDQSSNPNLDEIIDHHLHETQLQVNRLERIFERMKLSPKGEHCEAMNGLIKEAEDIMTRCSDPPVKDAGIITAIQHINHYEIAGYGTAIAYAKAMKKDKLAEILLETLREEKQADDDLSEVAVEINRQAFKSKSTAE